MGRDAHRGRRVTTGAPARIALLGVGTVGSAVLARLAGLRGSGLELAYVGDSRRAYCPETAAGPRARLQPVGAALPLADLPARLGEHHTRIVVDATASAAVAAALAGWLARGVHVATACKLGQGGPLAQWCAIRDACARAGTRYGDRATVGAGLPLLDTLRALQAGGDRIHGLAGVLSGSLAWLLDRHDGTVPFSSLVSQARAAGYTEPDPCEDLSGADVRRKLLILARAAGVPLEEHHVEVAPVPREGPADAHGPDNLATLDGPMQRQLDDARRRGARLQYVARLGRQAGRWRARIGLEAVPAGDPLAAGGATDNRVAIWSDRYRDRPVLIQGPGAGAAVTAAALLDDALQIVREVARVAPGLNAAREPALAPA